MGAATQGSLVHHVSQLVGSNQVARWICEDVADRASGEQAVEMALGLAQRFADGEPLQYILGHWSFRSLDLLCDPRALIPRPETEQLVELVKAHVKVNPGPMNVLDIGTGTGAIALSLAAELKGLSVLASDVSQAALDLAQENCMRLPSGCTEVAFVLSDLFSSLDGHHRFDVIVSNPPYVPTGSSIEHRVSNFEPALALFAGEDGLEVIRRIIAQSREWLVTGGSKVFLEVDEMHGPAISLLARESGYSKCLIKRDLTGRDRFAILTY